MKIIEFIHAKSELNPLIWNQDMLDQQVRLKLISIAVHFKNFVEIDFPVLDLQLTGGMVSRYYTEHSDLDLHIITDYDKIDCDQEASELFDTKRKLYKVEHDIEIKGIPVELYVEDVNQPSKGGAFSLLKNKWLRRAPEPKGEINYSAVETNTEKFHNLINRAIASNDIHSLEQVKKFIWSYRQQGLAKDGEYGVANLTFKNLRNKGILADLITAFKRLQDQSLGLK